MLNLSKSELLPSTDDELVKIMSALRVFDLVRTRDCRGFASTRDARIRSPFAAVAAGRQARSRPTHALGV